MDKIFEKLLNSDEPAIRYKALVNLKGIKTDSAAAKKARREIKKSERTKGLLAHRESDGTINLHPYNKWDGAHWVLMSLADLNYPPGDKSLIPLRNQTYEWLFSEQHDKNIRLINGRTRRCTSQEGNALYSALLLGIADKRADQLAERLCSWQWPDGGWNCDKKPHVEISSYRETIIPAKALNLHYRLTGNKASGLAVEKTAELFLKRKLFRRLKDNSIMRQSFVEIHFPRYFEYDYLHALVVLADSGFIKDPRCTEALDLLESKRLPDGGFPCERKIYRYSPDKKLPRVSRVDWGGSRKTMNEFITVDALYVLKAAGRIK